MRIFRSGLRIVIFLSVTCHALSIPAIPDSDETGSYPAPTGINQRRDVDPTAEAGATTTTCNCRHRRRHQDHDYYDSDDMDPEDVDPNDIDPDDVDPDDMDPSDVDPGDVNSDEAGHEDKKIIDSTPTLVVPVTVYANGTNYSTKTYLPATDSASSTSESEPLMGIITGPAQATSTSLPAGRSTVSGSASSGSTNPEQPAPSPASPKDSTNQELAPIQEQPPSQPPPNQAPPPGQVLPNQASPNQESPQSQTPPSQVQSIQVPPPSQAAAPQAPESSQAAAGSQVAPSSQAPPSQYPATYQAPPPGQPSPSQAPPSQPQSEIPSGQVPPPSQAPASQAIASSQTAAASQGPLPSQAPVSQATASSQAVAGNEVPPPIQAPVSQAIASSQTTARSEVPPPSQAPVSQATASSQAVAGNEVPPPIQAPVSQAIASSQTTARSEVPPPSQEVASQAASTSQLAATTKDPATSLAAATNQTTPAAAPSNATAAAAVPTPASMSNTTIPFLRGVNIGNWLILEKWMEPDLFTGATAAAVDQWTFDSTPNAAAALQQHWSTWFTASDAKTLASYGINALRIPIGYWAYDATDTPFIQGADHYLELAIQWARELNMKVWVDLHGSPGSQNGQDHSGRKGRVLWQQGDNLNRSTAVLVTMARKYGSAMYADVVVGLEVVNEPAFAGNNSFGVSQQWAADAYRAIKAVATNPHLVVVTHDSFQGPTAFAPVARALGPAAAAARDFAVDTHNYQLYTDADNALTQAEHIRKACAWAPDLRAARASLPVYVGEWSALTNVCVHADGGSTAGTSCSASGCQCVSSADPKAWNVRTVEAVRRYVEAQLDVWEASTDGYFLWTFGGPGGWGLGNLVAAGAMPSPVTERKFPGQCG